MELFDILTFDEEVVENLPVETTDPDWTEAVHLVTPDRAAGKYGLAFSLQFTLNSTSQSFMYQFSTDGGSTWGPIYQKEVKDRSNTEVLEVLNTIDHPGGPIDIVCQVTRESTADCNIIKAVITAERKA
jgi:hypothetical protein